MAYIPQLVSNKALTADTLNAIGNDIGVGVTVVQDDLSTLHSFANVVLGNSVMQNSFLSALVNRIVKVIYSSRIFRNPLAVLKRGILEYGQTIEEIYVDMAKGVKRNEDKSNPSYPYEVTIPDVKTTFHLSNLRCKYPVTIYNMDLRKAFLSFGAVDEMIARLVESLYTAHGFDEYLLTKFKIAMVALSRIKANADFNLTLADEATEKEYATAILRTARKLAKLWPIPKTQYNEAGVWAHTPNENLVCFITADASAVVDVDALAGAFNMEKANFIGRIIDVDNFTFTDAEIARICQITDMTPEAFPITTDDMNLLEGCACIMADEQLLQIWDTYAPKFTEQYNASDDYWNFYLHVDQVFSASPFQNVGVIDNR